MMMKKCPELNVCICYCYLFTPQIFRMLYLLNNETLQRKEKLLVQHQ